jgi:HSP20 family protein
MTKVKKSFFEKLTGARRIDEANDGFEREEMIQPRANVYSEETETEMIINSSTREPMMRETPVSNYQQEDGEGQLTIDVYQTENDIVIKSTIAGVKPEDLDVSINNDMITIRGERKQDEEVSHEHYYYQECYWGGFSRSVILPVDVLAEKVEASMKNGILTIRLPKADNTRTKKIQVRGF